MSPEIAYVTAARVLDGMVVVDVSLGRPNSADQNIPFHQPAPGVMLMPRQGDRVLLWAADDGSSFAMFPTNPPEFEMPDLLEGEMCFRFDDETEIRVQQNAGSFDVRITAGANVNIEADGDATLSVGGDVTASAAGSITVEAPEVVVDADESVKVLAGTRVELGGPNGESVARLGDYVKIADPISGAVYGEIVSASNRVTST